MVKRFPWKQEVDGQENDLAFEEEKERLERVGDMSSPPWMKKSRIKDIHLTILVTLILLLLLLAQQPGKIPENGENGGRRKRDL